MQDNSSMTEHNSSEVAKGNATPPGQEVSPSHVPCHQIVHWYTFAQLVGQRNCESTVLTEYATQ